MAANPTVGPQRSAPHAAERRAAARGLSAVVTALLLALLAFLLLPTGSVNQRSLISVNGALYLIPASTQVSEIEAVTTLLARPGSSLDLTGDVTALAGGAGADRSLDGGVLTRDAGLADGSRILVRHGEHRLEGIARKTSAIAFDTTVEGQGPFVSLDHAGEPGLREEFKGTSSHKQAAAFVLSTPQDALVVRGGSAKPGQKLAALTFDDGPGTSTQAVLDALAGKHVPATFFVLGGCAAGNREMIQKIKDAGHEVENHTWGHPILTEVSEDTVRKEIARTDSVIGGCRYLRPPYGIYDAKVASIAGDMGLKIVLWTVDTLDWKFPDPEQILSRVKAQTKPGAIILMHDGGKDRSQTVAAIPRVVDWLFANGYTLTTVDGLL